MMATLPALFMAVTVKLLRPWLNAVPLTDQSIVGWVPVRVATPEGPRSLVHVTDDTKFASVTVPARSRLAAVVL
jgi:hypothetical protein